MITYHTNGEAHTGGFFMVNGERGTNCDTVLDLFINGMNADKEATRILSKWKKEGEDEAARNDAAWDKFHKETHGAYVNGIY